MTPDRTPVFETERLLVRKATVEDVELFYSLWTSPEVMVNVGFPQGLRIAREDLHDRLAGQGEGVFDRLLVVELGQTGRAIGECYLHRPRDAGIAEPDVKLLPAFWGRGYGSEAWGALISYLFTHTNCQVVQGTPNVKNVASIRMQEAAGAVRVGEGVCRFPESMSDYTAPVHHYVYQIRRGDWERRRGERQAT
jgi:RimJ/RimL family protein N-acetyltransferase